jgi:hypothetical protein
MADFYIDSMMLEVPGFSPTDSQQLAFEIATGLGAEGSIFTPREIPSLRLEIPADENRPSTELGRRIVVEILREIRRLP